MKASLSLREQYRTVITLNNDGVNHLVRGNYDGAILTIRNALGVIRNTIITDPSCSSATTRTTTTSGGSGGNTNPVMRSSSLSPARVPDFWYNVPHSSRKHQSCKGYVFSYPIRLQEVHDVQPQTSATVTATTIAIMYNLALSFHLMGRRRRDESERFEHYDRAITLYKLCYNMLLINHHLDGGSNNGDQRPITIDFDPCFLMAVSNNLGVIYKERGETKVATTYFQHLLSTQMYCHINILCNNNNSNGVVPDSTSSGSPDNRGTATIEIDDNDDSSEGDYSVGDDDNSHSQEESNTMLLQQQVIDDFWSNTLDLVLLPGTAAAA